MKKIFSLGLIIMLSMTLMPFSVPDRAENKPTAAVFAKIIQSDKKDEFRVLDKESGKITVIPAADYVFGVVAAEIPMTYEDEAIKAQTVASYTYACYKREHSQKSDYDITTDCNTDQSYISNEKLKEKWGEKYDEYSKRLHEIIKSVEGKTVTYDGKPILAVYHSVSSGATESCETVWGSKIGYLLSVPAEEDLLCSDLSKSKSFTHAELKKLVSDAAKIGENAEIKITDVKTNDNGYVLSLKLNGQEITGAKLRELLGLSSANFNAVATGDGWRFTSYGKGHLVGMSQNCANEMAKNGSDYTEILKHFYTGVKI